MANLPASAAVYDEEVADEAAAALLWLTARQESISEPWHVSRALPAELLERMEARGWTARSGSERLLLTPEGRRRFEEAFVRLLGRPRKATLPPPKRTKVVQEEDGE